MRDELRVESMDGDGSFVAKAFCADLDIEVDEVLENVLLGGISVVDESQEMVGVGLGVWVQTVGTGPVRVCQLRGFAAEVQTIDEVKEVDEEVEWAWKDARCWMEE